jgi:hypothetical protein
MGRMSPRVLALRALFFLSLGVVMAVDCAPGCHSYWRGDGTCDTACDNAAWYVFCAD